MPPGPLAGIAFLPLPEYGPAPDLGPATAYRVADDFSATPSSVRFFSNRPGLGVYTVGSGKDTRLVTLSPAAHAQMLAAYRADGRPQQLHARDSLSARFASQIRNISEAQPASAEDSFRYEPESVSASAAARVSGWNRLKFWSPSWRAALAAVCLSLDRPWTEYRAIDLTRRAKWAETRLGVDTDSFVGAFIERAARKSDGTVPLLAYLTGAPSATVSAPEPTVSTVASAGGAVRGEASAIPGVGPLLDVGFSIPTPSFASLHAPEGRSRRYAYETCALHHFPKVDPQEAMAMSGPYGHPIDENILDDWDSIRFFSSGVPFGVFLVRDVAGSQFSLVRLSHLDFHDLMDDFRWDESAGRESATLSTVDPEAPSFQGTLCAFARVPQLDRSRIFNTKASGLANASEEYVDALERSVHEALQEVGLQAVDLDTNPLRLQAAAESAQRRLLSWRAAKIAKGPCPPGVDYLKHDDYLDEFVGYRPPVAGPGELAVIERMRLAAVFFCSADLWADESIPDFTQRVELAGRWFNFENYQQYEVTDCQTLPFFDPSRFVDFCFDYYARCTGDHRPRLTYVRDCPPHPAYSGSDRWSEFVRQPKPNYRRGRPISSQVAEFLDDRRRIRPFRRKQFSFAHGDTRALALTRR